MTRPFYFQPGAEPVDWESRESVILANPEWIRRQADGSRSVARRLPALDAHVWVSTSGTSSDVPGRVRWIALSKDAFLASARAVNEHLGATSADTWAHALPVFHVGGLGILARGWLSGAKVVPAIVNRWEAAGFHAVASRTGATLSALVPSQIHDLVASGLASPPSMRAIVVGGARMEPALYRRARALGWPCLPSYGLTETCSQVATASLSSLSVPEYPAALPVLTHAEIRAGHGQRLAIRATSLLTCCAELDDDDVRVWDPKRDGWLETEDTGRVTGDGVDVLGRVSDSVKVLGEVVSLVWIEEQARRWAGQEGLRAIPGFDLGVVAVPHSRLGHEVVVAIACHPRPDDARRDALVASLASFCRENLLPFERIQRLAWVDRIPRTPLGKCQRPLLTRHVSEQARPDR
ncbi:MAG TPA: AMP-binding protein [Vicinamibacterales bacterium]